MPNKEKGFSLIELIVVLIITAILSQIGFTAFNRYVRRTRAFAAKTALLNIKKECESNSDIKAAEEFTALAPAGYSLLSGNLGDCNGNNGLIVAKPNNPSRLPEYSYDFSNRSRVKCSKNSSDNFFKNCGDGVPEKINLNQDFIVANTYKERDCSGYVLVEGPSWSEAQANAIKLGGNLVTINNKEENDWIFKNFEQISTGSSEGLGVMIGITDGEEEGTWKWISGEEVTYSNWGTNQPDNSRGLENHSVIGWDRGTWNDIQEDWNNLQTKTKWGEVKGLVEVQICN